MASSNRHWPSLFKSKPCNNQQWPQQHHDINPCARSSSSSPFSSGCEERSPEPKPRWNPKPEQIRILEAIFNSGMVNPPRDEIRRIRAQLQEYGQVGDANVFYWFQNRKSRSKHKQRSKASTTASAAGNQRTQPPMSASSSSSTTSSDKASPKKPTGAAVVTLGDTNNSTTNHNNNSSSTNNPVVDQFGINNSPTSVNQCCSYFHPNSDQFVGHHQEPVFFPLQQSGASVLGGGGGGFGPGLGLGFGHDLSNVGLSVGTVPEHGVIGGTGFSNLLLREMIDGGGGESKREEVEKFKFQPELSFLVTNPPNTSCTLPTPTPSAITNTTTASSGVMSSNLGQLLGLGDQTGGMTGKSTVFVDNMTIDVPAGLFNVKEAFGDDAILVHPSGHPVLTNDWGVTLHPLQNGAFYYVVRPTVAASPLLDKLDTTPDLLAPEFPYQI